MLPVDLSGEGERSPITTDKLNAPDEDGDGYVARDADGKGGTDCDDSGPMASVKFPGNIEVCDFEDNNCSGVADEGFPVMTIFRDVDGDGVGNEQRQSCMPATGYSAEGGDCDDNNANRSPRKTELCDEVDNNCNNVVDEGHDKNWYLDDDGDQVPRGPTATVQCNSPGPKYMKYPSGPPFDCDDANDRRAPNKPEICDGIDNNCASNNGVEIDENFPTKGTSCSQGCGTLQCAQGGASLQCSAPEPDIYYQDKDGDGDGIATVIPGVNPKLVCQGVQPPSGYARNQSADCDDIDPAMSSLRTEVCDAIDNNCDGTVDNTAVSCGGTLKEVVDHHVGGNNHDWTTVSTGPGGYPVWVAGRGGKLMVRKDVNQKFENFSFGDPTTPAPTDGSPPLRPNHCGSTNWTVSWVHSNGTVFLGGEGGVLAVHTGGTIDCGLGGVTTSSENLTGMVGFESGGLTTIYLTNTAGHLIKWAVGGDPQHVLMHDSNYNYYGIHGLNENFLLVSGGSTVGPPPQAFQEFQSYSNGNPSSLHATFPDNVSGTANAVWMGTATKACAVGDGGLAWRWDGSTTWNQAEASGTTVDFSSVVMRYDAQNTSNPLNNQCYIVDKSTNGKLRRLTPFGWAKPFDLLPSSRADKPLRDIAITATGELWIVGDDGRVFHYPEP